MKKISKILLYFIIITTTSIGVISNEVFAQTQNELNNSFDHAKEFFKNGEYKEAITIYDKILEITPDSKLTLKMKGIALSNINEHTKSLEHFFKIIQQDPRDSEALTGMGVGFGNLGEYKESLHYLERAESENSDSIVIKNYKLFVEGVIKKYPYTPTEKQIDFKKVIKGSVPKWVQYTAGWWSLDKISDQNFLNSLEYMIKKDIIIISNEQLSENKNELKMLSSVRTDVGIWSQNQNSDEKFFDSIKWLIKNKFIDQDIKKLEKSQEELEHERYEFKKYLRDISKNISKEKRYIEYPNPSNDVIKKFLRDYLKWNFEQQVQMSSNSFPDPTYQIIDEEYTIYYKIFINQQPIGLPLDHVSTLTNSLEYWENVKLNVNDQNAKIKFQITNSKIEANVWVTWVVRNIGEGVLGHAHLGKGVVEVALGDYNCDGSFQLYDVKSVEQIMTHELGHSVGLPHTNDRANIMYPSYTPSYAYCLIN